MIHKQAPGYALGMRPAALIPLAVFAAVAAFMTAPAWLTATPSVVGELNGLDLVGSYWSHWWTADAIGRGVSPFAGTHSFYPSGQSPLLQYNLLDAAIHAPFGWAFGPRLGYNAACFAALVATGWAAHRLARSAGISASVALLTGVLVEASSFVALELHCGRISQAVLVFLLLALSGTLRILNGDHRTGHAALTGAFAAATALVYWYFGAALLLAGLAILWGNRSAIVRPTLRALGIAVACALVLTVPFVVDLMGTWSSLPGVQRPDAADIIRANSRTPWWPVFNSQPIFGHQLSLVAIGLAGVAVWKRIPQWLAWASIAAIGWALALGPGASVLLPFDWLQRLVPTFDRMWWPYRFEVLTVIAVAVMAGRGLDALLRDRPKRGWWIAGAIALCVADAPLRSELLPLSASELPRASASLYSDSSGPILTVPIQPNATETERLMLFQTEHGMPIPIGDGAHLSEHVPAAHTEWVQSNGLLTALNALNATGTVTATIDPSDVEALLNDGFQVAVVDPAVFDAPQASFRSAAYARFFRALWGDPIRRVGRGGTWTISPIAEPVTVSVTPSTRSDRLRRRRRP